jgi:hypothetical protein
MQLHAQLARQFEEKTGYPLLKTISVGCFDESGNQILNLYARYDVARSVTRYGNPQLEKLLLDDAENVRKVVGFNLDEEHDAETRSFLRDVISSSWHFDVEKFISDFMTDENDDPFVKIQREMTLPLGATHVIKLQSAYFKSDTFTSAKLAGCKTVKLTRLVRRWFDMDKTPDLDEVGPATKRPRRENVSESAFIEESLKEGSVWSGAI